MQRSHHIGSLTNWLNGIRSFKLKSNLVTLKKVGEWRTMEDMSLVSQEDVMFVPQTNQLTKTQRKQVEDYLSTFRAITVPKNSNFDLIADVIPYDEGVVMRLAFGTKGGGDINFCKPKRNIVEASKIYDIDIDQYSSQVDTDKPEGKRTYVIIEDKKIIYLIKGFGAPENWGTTSVNRDIAAILGGTV